MAKNLASIKADLKWKLRDLWESWQALPKTTRWQIALGSLAAAALAITLSAWLVFGRRPSASNPEDSGEVVLYTSVDSYLIAPVTQAFEAATGLKVKVVGDTEATKTTGLVERLLAEKSAPRADVWWSSEAMGTVALANAGVLDPFASKSESQIPGGWPPHLRAPDRTWYGFAQRARVIAYNTNRVSKINAPTRLRDLTRSEWAGKVGIARPQFGTTRTHIGALVAMHGVDEARAWLEAMRANDVKIYDGNSSVVQALSVGEIEIGLTDSDDVYSGQRNTWPVDFVFESVDKPSATRPKGLPSVGPVIIPNTVGLIRAGPHPNQGRRLADFLLSAEVEKILATSDSRNMPIRPEVAKAAGLTPFPDPAPARPADVADAMAQADKLIAEFFPLQ